MTLICLYANKNNAYSGVDIIWRKNTKSIIPASGSFFEGRSNRADRGQGLM